MINNFMLERNSFLLCETSEFIKERIIDSLAGFYGYATWVQTLILQSTMQSRH